MEKRTATALALVGATALAGAACDDGTAGLTPETALVSVAPMGGAAEVALDAAVVVRFDHPMHAGAPAYAAVHVGGITGPTVQGHWGSEEDGSVLRFTPDGGWMGGTEYAVHLGGGMMDAEGHGVDFISHGMDMGGVWADGSMMNGGMMMGGGQHPHMGAGWQHENGSYGMVFGFGTAGTVAASLVGIEPAGGATEVDPAAPIVVSFDHALDPAMTEYAALHEGGVTGAVVAGEWSLSEDSTQLLFTQDEPLKPATEYTIHLGSGMMDADGHHVDVGSHGAQMGGEWATDSMMSGGMHGGMNGSHHDHMGGGWDHPENGSHGMTFTFTTAG